MANRQIYNRNIKVDSVTIFYREAGDKNNPSLLLLHGFPTSSIMFKNLMVVLSERYYLVAPDYPGFGFSDFPDAMSFEYSFENIAAYINKFTDAINLKSFAIYLQNGNAYMEGLGPQWDETRDYWEHPTEEKKKRVSGFLSKEGTKTQYTSGLSDELLSRVSPESWRIDWERMSRPGNVDIQFTLNSSYKTNLEMYPVFQEYFRRHQPPALVIWGKYDVFFDVAEASCYKRDLPHAEVHILDGGHMALETNFDEVLSLVSNFMTSE
jgi:pimeloyl-ACP methyl ester carboxylesterase